jgi:hypothetical protein
VPFVRRLLVRFSWGLLLASQMLPKAMAGKRPVSVMPISSVFLGKHPALSH